MLWTFLLKIINKVMELERKQLEKEGIKSLFIARFYSLSSLMICVFFSSLVFTFLVTQLLVMFKYQVNDKQPFWWSIPSLLTLPALIPLFSNFIKRNFNYSEKFMNIIQTMQLTNPSFLSLKSTFEIISALLYVFVGVLLTVKVMDNFIKDQLLMKILKLKQDKVIIIIALIHTAIYLSLRVLILPEESVYERFVKSKRKFHLWIMALVVTLSYMSYKIFTTKGSSVDFIYLTFVLFISIDRTINSYKELRRAVADFLDKSSDLSDGILSSIGYQILNHFSKKAG